MKNVLIYCLLPTFIYAQKLNEQLYYDDFGLQGRVHYSGEWTADKLPHTGAYKLSWRELKEDTIETFFCNGKTLKHLPTGQWQWQQGIWHSSYAPGSSIFPEVKSSGLIYTWIGNFRNGLPHGIWIYTADSTASAEITQTLINAKAQYNFGALSGSFNIKVSKPNYVIQLDGETDINGLSTGIWTIQLIKGNEKKILKHKYINGLFVNSIYEYYQDGKLFSQGKTESSTAKNYFDETLKKALPYKIEVSDSLFTSGFIFPLDSITPLANHELSAFLNDGWQLNAFPYQVHRRGPFFRNFIYPLSDIEINQLQQITDKTKILENEVGQRMMYRNLLLNRSASAELDISIGFLEQTVKKLENVQELLKEAGHSSFLFFFRHDVVHAYDWCKSLLKPDTIVAEFFDTLSLYPTLKQTETALFETMLAYINLVDTEFNKHKNTIDSAYLARKREVEIEGLEDELSLKIQQLDNVYSLASGYAAFVRDKWIYENLYQSVSEYNNLMVFDEQKRALINLIGKADTLLALGKHWASIDKSAETLKENYTLYEYNPFNGKFDIEKRKKRRFYNRINGTFLPWMDEELKRIDDWSDWLAFVATYQGKLQCLVDFANQEDNAAQRLEKRIHNERSAEKILKTMQNYCRKIDL